MLKHLSLIGVLCSPSLSFATPFDNFGPLTEATFGGNGIPNDPVAIRTVTTDSGSLITLGLSATQRFGSPEVTNDGNGTYFAGPGTSVSSGGVEGSLWNFNYYINIDAADAGDEDGGQIQDGELIDNTDQDEENPSPAESLADYTFELFYDFNPAEDNTDLGSILIDLELPLTTIQDSQNLLFGFLTAPGLILPGVTVTPPVGQTFDPFALGEYTFGLAVNGIDSGNNAVWIDVEVASVPEPSSIAILGLGLAALAYSRKKLL